MHIICVCRQTITHTVCIYICSATCQSTVLLYLWLVGFPIPSLRAERCVLSRGHRRTDFQTKHTMPDMRHVGKLRRKSKKCQQEGFASLYLRCCCCNWIAIGLLLDCCFYCSAIAAVIVSLLLFGPRTGLEQWHNKLISMKTMTICLLTSGLWGSGEIDRQSRGNQVAT